jgi:translation initiation factor 5
VWHTDTSKEAQEARKQAEFADIIAKGEKKKTLEDIMNAGGEGSRDLPAVVLKVFMAEKNRTDNEVISECRRLQLARGLDEPQKVKVLLEAVIDTKTEEDVKNIAKSYRKNAKLIAKLVGQEKRSAQILIGCIEEQVGIVAPRLMPRVPLILQALYEEDVLSEDVLLAWHASPPESSWLSNNEVATKVREKATPFIDWLKNAEESSGEEEDE